MFKADTVAKARKSPSLMGSGTVPAALAVINDAAIVQTANGATTAKSMPDLALDKNPASDPMHTMIRDSAMAVFVGS
jgi:hypothetical protein